ncbi:hypothetical protein ILYODFUR_010429 [Ilyodon furcidens]|uniref:Uncharacterized protein n=1 Tax=Ilyodon furcidens TaxID=33524 RepID=A0ABV0SYW1_9TELE
MCDLSSLWVNADKMTQCKYEAGAGTPWQRLHAALSRVLSAPAAWSKRCLGKVPGWMHRPRTLPSPAPRSLCGEPLTVLFPIILQPSK